jgi:cell fate regulator YaaT (PSP1 superfamily)
MIDLNLDARHRSRDCEQQWDDSIQEALFALDTKLSTIEARLDYIELNISPAAASGAEFIDMIEHRRREAENDLREIAKDIAKSLSDDTAKKLVLNAEQVRADVTATIRKIYDEELEKYVNAYKKRLSEVELPI